MVGKCQIHWKIVEVANQEWPKDIKISEGQVHSEKSDRLFSKINIAMDRHEIDLEVNIAMDRHEIDLEVHIRF